MEKVIRYNGHTAQPSDYETPDGDLALSLGLVHEDESLRSVLPPEQLFNVPSGYKVAYIHKTSSFAHYILLKYTSGTWTAYWVDNALVEAASSHPYDFAISDIHLIDGYSYSSSDEPKVVGIGNTLVFYAVAGMNYVLWKDDDYKYLGSHIPEVELSMGLLGRPRFYSLVYGSTFNISFDSISESDIQNGKTFSESNQTRITEQVMGKLNKFVADTTVNHGRHCFPFMVRYAFRLYDNSLTMHSAPILMNPCTNCGPIVFWDWAAGNGSYTSATLNIMLVAAELTYQIAQSSDLTAIRNWKDIVKSIDIFISKPIYTYNQDGKIASFADTDNFDTKFIGKLYAHTENGNIQFVRQGDPPAKSRLIAPITNAAEILTYYSEWPYHQLYGLYFKDDRGHPDTTLHLPEFDTETVRENISNCSNFYLLHSIAIEDLTDEETTIETPNDYLPSLVARETMTDDYQSHDIFSPQNAYAYNNRLNISNIGRTLFNGFDAETMFARCQRTHSYSVDSNNNQVTINADFLYDEGMRIYTYIKENGQEYIVKSNHIYNTLRMVEFFTHEYSGTTVNRSSMCWFFYPNANATKMVVEQGGIYRYEVKLEPHAMLNGACALLPYEAAREHQNIGAPTRGSTDVIVPVPNKIYTSEVNNPFFFPLLGINTVGSGQILGLASATKALSQGQFGQFPLYAFTTDGVWALEVSSTGSYSARQPVTRDVCISMESITQLDSSVVFATDRGLMMLQGSEALCLSDDVRLEDEEDYATMCRGLQLSCDPSLSGALHIVPLRDFIKDCRLMYDYTNQHILVYNTSRSYAYVFSLKSKKWGMIKSNLKASLNSYPDSICVISGQSNDVVVDYSGTDVTASTEMPFVVLTRPLKLDAPDIMKTIDTIIQRGKFVRGHVKTLLYGSRDLYNWQLVYTSTDHYLRGFRGTPYKYYRIALVGAMTKDERIFGCEISFTPRLVDQLR